MMEDKEIQALWKQILPIHYRLWGISFTLMYALIRIVEFGYPKSLATMDWLIVLLKISCAICFLVCFCLGFYAFYKPLGKISRCWSLESGTRMVELGYMGYMKHALIFIPGIILLEILFWVIK